jgi:hypothetical protein
VDLYNDPARVLPGRGWDASTLKIEDAQLVYKLIENPNDFEIILLRRQGFVKTLKTLGFDSFDSFEQVQQFLAYYRTTSWGEAEGYDLDYTIIQVDGVLT